MTQNKKSRFVDVLELSQELSVTESTIYRWVKLGKFPKPLRLGLRRLVWLRCEYEQHITNAIEAKEKADEIVQ